MMQNLNKWQVFKDEKYDEYGIKDLRGNLIVLPRLPSSSAHTLVNSHNAALSDAAVVSSIDFEHLADDVREHIGEDWDKFDELAQQIDIDHDEFWSALAEAEKNFRKVHNLD